VVTRVEGERRRWSDRKELLTFLRRQLWAQAGSATDARLVAAMDALVATAADGSVGIRDTQPLDIGIVSWAPRHDIR
jgi:hypothetical protein